MATLSQKDRDDLPKSAFAIPETRSYPVHDEAHARAALSMAAKHAPAHIEKRVKAAVRRRYPDMGKD